MDGHEVKALRTIMERLTFGRGQVQGTLKREHAALRDVSPCSEYTRYTMEGTLKDPFSDLSVLLDVPSLGTLFMNGPFLEPRWSPALGYGLAVIEDDTRVHLYRSGKFVIRRARDREHVEACYRLICELVRPAIVLPDPGLLFYEAIALQRQFSEAGFEGDLLKAVNWPEIGPVKEGDLRAFMDGPEDVRHRLRGLVLPSVRSLLSRTAEGDMTRSHELDKVKEGIISSMRASMMDLNGKGPMMSSTASIHLAALRSLELIIEVHTPIASDNDLSRSALGILDSIDDGHDISAIPADLTQGYDLQGDAVKGLAAALSLIP